MIPLCGFRKLAHEITMMNDERKLILIRHAKSSWDNPHDSDFERPLNDRGLRDAPRIGRWLNEHTVPNMIITSPANRAKTTAQLLLEELETECPLVEEAAIYEATLEDLIDIVRECSDTIHQLVLVGHNPTFQALAGRLHGEPIEYPTAAVSIFSSNSLASWSEFNPNQASTNWGLEQFMTPKRLPA